MMSYLEVAAYLYVVVTIHESGHLTAAYLLDLPVLTMKVGYGPILYRYNFQGIICKFCLFPITGVVNFFPSARFPWKNITVMSAGSLANLLTGLVALCFSWTVFADISLISSALNLLPIAEFDGKEILVYVRKAAEKRRKALAR